MEKSQTLTYGQLTKRLSEYGYTAYNVTVGEKKAISFENMKVPGSQILLPQHENHELVEQFYMNHVLMTLRACGILKETNPLLP